MRLWAGQVPYQAVMQPDRMLPNVHLNKLARVLGAKPNFFSLLRVKMRCCAFFTTLSVWVDQFSLSVMCTQRNLTYYPLHYCPVDVDRGCSLCCFLKSTVISFVLLTLSVRLFS